MTNREKALTALNHLAQWRCDDRGQWLRVGMALHATDASAAMLDAWDRWSGKSEKYEPGECARQWRSFKADGGVGLGTLLRMAIEDSAPLPKRGPKPPHSDRHDDRDLEGRGTRPERRAYPTLDAALGAAVRAARGKLDGAWKVVKKFAYSETFVVARLEAEGKRERKTFFPIHRAAEGWVLADPPGRLPLYRLPELLAAKSKGPVRVFVPEGEGKVDLVRGLGLDATTAAHGASASAKSDWSPLAGPNVEVVLLPDKDPAGEKCIAERCEILSALDRPPRVVIVRLDVPNEGDDIEQWIAARPGRRPEQFAADLDALADAAPEWTPQARQSEPDAPPPEAEEPDEEGPRFRHDEGEGGPKRTQADRLVALVRESGAELWHTPDGECYATIRQDGHDEHLRIRDREFRQWLAYAAAKATRRAPSRNAIDDALSALGGEAIYAGRERAVHIRLAAHEDKVMLDLGDRERRVVEIGADGWKAIVDDRLPVRFRRSPGALALPVPVRGGNIDDLLPLLNVEEADFDLVVAWLLGALNPNGPYAALEVTGEHGTGKSVLCKTLVALVDPKDVPLRRPPKDERDLFVAAGKGHIVAFNNISKLTPDLSDALSSLATEGGFAVRKLYENDEEARFKGRRPILLNGIEDFVTRGDLGDRCLRLVLPRVTRRRTEEEILREFQDRRPALLGALLDGVSCALRRRGEVRIDELPRLADFALWVEGAAPGIGRKPGALVGRYRDAVEGAASSRIEDDVVASAVIRFMDGRTDWTGTAGDLLVHLGRVVELLDGNGAPAKAARPRDWPETPRKLSGDLTRLAPDLRAVGIEVERPRRATARSRARLWTVRTRREGAQPSEPSASSETGPRGGPEAGRCSDGRAGTPSDRPTERPHGKGDRERDSDGSDCSDGSVPPVGEEDGEAVVEVDL